MAASVTLWSSLLGALGAACGVIAKSAWDEYAGWRSNVPMETWKIRAHQLERRLSEFYWPLYSRLTRDDVVWGKVFNELRADQEPPEWAKEMDAKTRLKLAEEIEAKIILPNHLEAVGIIQSAIHLANADSEFQALLRRYVRHVDVYQSLRSAGIMNVDPLNIGEPYPEKLSEAVNFRLKQFQADYDELVREKGIADFKKSS